MDSAVRVDFLSRTGSLRVHIYLIMPTSDRVGISTGSQTAYSWAQCIINVNSRLRSYVLKIF